MKILVRFIIPEVIRNLKHTIAPLTFAVQEVSSSPSEITIEMHMHDGMEVGHYMGDNVK